MWNCESCVILHTEVSYYVGWYGLLESSPILYTNDLPSVWALFTNSNLFPKIFNLWVNICIYYTIKRTGTTIEGALISRMYPKVIVFKLESLGM